ncbi:MAG: methyltransferase, partial [Candidatus Pseudoruminococcus sp.]|nr:methyltransferase [Candidatus Pseudoruminococcus sp.]
ICQRPERLPDITEAMRKYNIEPKRLRFVQLNTKKTPKLLLIEGRRGGNKGGLKVEPTLLLEDDFGKCSQEMLEIYGSFAHGYQK